MNLLGKISLTLSILCILVTGGFKLSVPGWIPFIGWGIGFGVFFLVFAIATNIYMGGAPKQPATFIV